MIFCRIQQCTAFIVVKVTRQNAGRNENTSYALIDSQSLKTAYASDPSMGKKTKGLKRNIATDTIGCMLNVTVHKANKHDTKMGWWVAEPALFTYPTIKRFCADRGYRRTFIHDVNIILQRGVDISEKIKPLAYRTKTLGSRKDFCLVEQLTSLKQRLRDTNNLIRINGKNISYPHFTEASVNTFFNCVIIPNCLSGERQW